VKLPTLYELRRGTEYILINFATPIVFYFAFREWGAKAAIGFAIGVTCIQIFFHWFYSIRFSPFFLVASGFTVCFGSIDLVLDNPRFFRLEPFAQNFLIASAFLFTYFAKIPVIHYFVKALPPKFAPQITTSTATYLRKLTLVWVIYLYLKSLLFLYLAFEVDLGSLIVLRSLIGGGTLALMFVGELIYRKCFRQGS
jgi:intracellular septation protein A